jgi:hypothetical protein
MNLGKTIKGKSALEQRSASLPQRLRPLLLLIDGNKSNEQLESLAGQIGLSRAALEELQQLGFIAPGANASSEMTMRRFDDDDDRTVRVSHNAIDRFLQAKKFMTGALAQAGAPSDSGIAAQIEAATEMSQLTLAYDGFVTMIETMKPAEAASTVAKLRALLH